MKGHIESRPLPTVTDRAARQPHLKHGGISDRLRQAILAGRLKPGACLPTRVELCRQFSTTPVTLQKAMARLKADGFIVTAGRCGTTVAARPPHLHRFGLVFCHGTATPETADMSRDWSLFDAACVRVARQLQQQTGDLEFAFYFHVDERMDGPDVARLAADVAHHRLAGLIYVDPPYWIERVPGLKESGVAQVQFGGAEDGHALSSIRGDQLRWCRRATEYLRARGRSRLAAVWGTRGPGCDTSPYYQRLRGYLQRAWPGMPDHWVCPVHVQAPESGRSFVQALLALPSRQRPDALLVGDDHLVEQVGLGLARSGVAVGRDLDVVAACNFPFPPPVTVPVTWLGHDVPAVLQTCVEMLSAQEDDREVDLVNPWEPVFEHERQVRPAAAASAAIHAGEPASAIGAKGARA